MMEDLVESGHSPAQDAAIDDKVLFPNSPDPLYFTGDIASANFLPMRLQRLGFGHEALSVATWNGVKWVYGSMNAADILKARAASPRTKPSELKCDPSVKPADPVFCLVSRNETDTPDVLLAALVTVNASIKRVEVGELVTKGIKSVGP